MLTKLATLHLAALLAVGSVSAQTPQPVVVQAVPPAATTSPPAQTAQLPAVSSEALKALQELKAANADILARQEAALQHLDELQKAADQMKIYTKRG